MEPTNPTLGNVHVFPETVSSHSAFYNAHVLTHLQSHLGISTAKKNLSQNQGNKVNPEHSKVLFHLRLMNSYQKQNWDNFLDSVTDDHESDLGSEVEKPWPIITPSGICLIEAETQASLDEWVDSLDHNPDSLFYDGDGFGGYHRYVSYITLLHSSDEILE